jgi:preprotein translocase subunit SecE
VARKGRRPRERRPRQPESPVDPRQGLPTATHGVDNGAADADRDNGLEPVDLGEDAVDGEDAADREDAVDREDVVEDARVEGPDSFEDDDDEGAPAPLEHAMPDVELAEEQLAFGRPTEPEPDDGDDEDEFEREVEESIADRGAGGGGRGGRGGRRRGGGYDGGGPSGSSGGELAVSGDAAVVERGPNLVERLVAFLQGSWRELQRVQWPDRRQVMQATGVVIGFVIVAAVFLGVADWVSQKLVTFVLK